MRIPIEKIKPSPSRPDYGTKRRAWARRRRPGRMPIILAEKGNFYLLCGQSNFNEAKRAGDKTIECVVRRGLSKEEQEELQLADEYFSSLLPPMKMAESFIKYRDRYQVSQQELARRIGITAGTIHHYESLLRTLAPQLKKHVDDGRLTFKEARCIADINDYERQKELAKPFVESKLSSVHVEELASKVKVNPDRPVDDFVAEIIEEREDVVEATVATLLTGESEKSGEEPRLKIVEPNGKPPSVDQELEVLQENAFMMAGSFEQLASMDIPEYRRLRLISTLRILASRLDVALHHLNGGQSALDEKPRPIAGSRAVENGRRRSASLVKAKTR